MGYVKKVDMRIDHRGRPYTRIGPYRVTKESENMTGIYGDCGQLITSKPKWSQAIKLTKLLHEAYQEGADSQRDDSYWHYR